MNELALFAGAGGGILGGSLLGWRTVCAVENNEYARSVLIARQNDGCLKPFPIWDDVRTFDGRPWRGLVDVVSGGFPCQDISAAGAGAGIQGKKSGLWKEMARIIREVEPRFVFVENSAILTNRGLGDVLSDLAAMGFDARWGVLGAHHAGAPHKRNRIWILANANTKTRAPLRGKRPVVSCENIGGRNDGGGRNGHFGRQKPIRRTLHGKEMADAPQTRGGTDWWETEPGMGRVVDGLAHRMDRLKALGNGQVPAVAALAWEILIDEK